MKKLWSKLFGKRVEDVSDEKRHKYRYALQYDFIPELVYGIFTGRLDIDSFLSTDVWKVALNKIYGEEFYFDWDDFDYRKYGINDNEYTIVLLLFPRPRAVGDALYGAVLVNNRTNVAAYYTLELAVDGGYILGSATIKEHFYFGTLKNASKDSFFNWVIEQKQYI